MNGSGDVNISSTYISSSYFSSVSAYKHKLLCMAIKDLANVKIQMQSVSGFKFFAFVLFFVEN